MVFPFGCTRQLNSSGHRTLPLGYLDLFEFPVLRPTSRHDLCVSITISMESSGHPQGDCIIKKTCVIMYALMHQAGSLGVKAVFAREPRQIGYYPC